MEINPKLFVHKELPSFHPLSIEYKNFWREEKRLCIEGKWLDGYWMPPKLYYYATYGLINRVIDKYAKNQVLGRPILRDIEWVIFRDVTVARGFSGFSDDDTYSCHDSLRPRTIVEMTTMGEWEPELSPNCYNSKGERKEYVDPQEYIARRHSKNMGIPLYENEAKNYMYMTARGVGKSYSVAAIVAHEFLFDGQLSYIVDETPTVEIIVGAGASGYVKSLLKKVKTMLDKIPGLQTINGITYPSPLSKKTSGSLAAGSVLEQRYKKKVNGQWKEAGSLTAIKNVNYADNPFAAQGSRNSLMIFEEVGMHSNVLECHEASQENMRIEGRKIGTAIYLGTGGDLEGGGTVGAKEMYYHPEKYDMLKFMDTYEGKGYIGRFIPSYMNLPEFKDEYGFTKIEEAKREALRRRQVIQNRKGSEQALIKEIINAPVIPSEMFLSDGINILPSGEALRRLQELEYSSMYKLLEKVVTLTFDPTAPNGVSYQIDVAGKLRPINKFPWTDKNREGAVVIYEFPRDIGGIILPDSYIIGHDPYKDDSDTGESLGVIWVAKTPLHHDLIGHNEIVAEYVGRPYEGRDKVNEIMLKLSLLYGNAKIFFENSVGNTKEYFERHKRLDLLATKPSSIFSVGASYARAPSTEYGYPMSNQIIKKKGISALRDWLLESRGQEGDTIVRHIDRIPSRALLEEIAMFSYDGNFDRVMALIGVMFGFIQIHKNIETAIIAKATKASSLDFITKNKKLFYV